MEEKKLEHHQIEICKISKKEIDTTNERYCIILDCDGKDIYSFGFYKAELIKDIIKGNLDLVKAELSQKYLKLAGGMFQKLQQTIKN